MKAKRFWTSVEIKEEGETYTIWLDERVLKTPFKNDLKLPTQALAKAVAEEWRAVRDDIDPESMPMTRMSNSAQERISSQRREIEAHLIDYIEGDVLIYRAEAPEALVARQKLWNVWLDWVRPFGLELVPVTGILAQAQHENNPEHAVFWMSKLDDYQLVSFYEYVTLTASFVLAMAIVEGAISARRAFDLSRLDEDFQAEAWGMVDVKKEERDDKLAQILTAERFFQKLQ